MYMLLIVGISKSKANFYGINPFGGPWDLLFDYLVFYFYFYLLFYGCNLLLFIYYIRLV